MKTPYFVYLFLLFTLSCKKEADIQRKAAPPDQTEINKLKLNHSCPNLIKSRYIFPIYIQFIQLIQ